MKTFFLLLFPFLLFAQSYLTSSIPLPKTYILNLDPYPCDEACLRELLENEQIFSFLAHAQDRLEDPELNDARLIHISLFNLGAVRQDNKLRIALLLPHRIIGRYAFSTTNAVFAYMLTKNRAFEIKSYQIENEEPEELAKTLEAIKNDAYYYMIAPVTKDGATAIAQIHPDLNIYFPTINKNDIATTSSSLYFGGIDYRAQIDTLLTQATSPLVIFYDKSRLGKELQSYTRERFLAMDRNATHTEPNLYENIPEYTENEPPAALAEQDAQTLPEPRESFSYAIEKRTSNLERQIKDNAKIQNGSFVLNTPIVKSGMVMSQLTLYDANVTNILSTQINYDPLIFSMTQYNDRKNMIIANSIGKNNNILIETNTFLNNDIVYDWINYASTVGADFFFHMITQNEREYNLPMVDNQIEYPISLVEPSFSRFIPYIIHEEEPETPSEEVPFESSDMPSD